MLAGIFPMKALSLPHSLWRPNNGQKWKAREKNKNESLGHLEHEDIVGLKEVVFRCPASPCQNSLPQWHG